MRIPTTIVLAAALAAVATARADERAFVFTYEATTMPRGAVEYEQWVTWKASKAKDSDFDRLDFRHELEFGVTDHLQLAAYFDWRYQDGESVSNDRAEFRDVALEAIYNLSNPVTDPIGSALYGEVKIGDQLAELETKLILQKNFGKWIFAWNSTLEAEWEGSDYEEDKGELAQSFGASYQISPNLAVGGELVHEIEYDDWDEWEDHVVYLGPNVSVRTERWWVTVAPPFQVTDVDSEADFQTRLIFGINF